MSHVILSCWRNGAEARLSRDEVNHLAKLVAPGLPARTSPHIAEDPALQIIVTPSNPVLPLHEQSVCLGQMFGEANNWWQPDAAVPDGSYALYRVSPAEVELVTDAVGSRTIWYVNGDVWFLASSSQRALIYLLESFEPHPQASTWMLAAGNPGPGVAWDRRLCCVSPDSRVKLNRDSWQITVRREEIELREQPRSEEQHVASLRQALTDTFDRLPTLADGWVLQLSGGADSRVVLLELLKRGVKPPCLTWGLTREDCREPSSDQAIAFELARRYQLDLQYHVTGPELPGGSLANMCDRLFETFEARADHLEGIWALAGYPRMLGAEALGFVRGDEGFGWVEVQDARQARSSVALRLLSDYGDARAWESLGMSPCEVPAHLEQRDGESNEAWRDRLYHQYRIPTVLAAFGGLWQPFLETVNPLLSRRLIECVRTLPDPLRTGKRAFTQIAVDMCPDLPFAEISTATNPLNRPTMHPQVCDVILGELESRSARRWLPDALLRFLAEGFWWHRVALKATSPRNASFAFARARRAILRRLRPSPSVPLQIDFERFAGRAFAICRIHEILARDAAARSQWRGDAD